MPPVPDKAILLLPDDKSTIFNSTKAISWSHDNKFVLCCAEKLIIVNMVVSKPYGLKIEAYSTHIDETPDISSLDKFSVASGLLDFKASWNNLNEGNRQRLSLDPSLIEECLYLNPLLNTFRHAVCSPMCLELDRSQNLIAGLTQSHRVLIYVEKRQGWTVLLDCAAEIKEHIISNLKLPITLGQDMTLDNYIDLIHSMCTVEIEWSTMFSQNGNLQNTFLLLFTGTRVGTILVWKACLPLEAREDFTFQCLDTYTSEVTAMRWLGRDNNQGLLAAGYLDGSVRILSVCANCDPLTSSVDVKEMFSDLPCDGLLISDLAWVSLDKNTAALIGCKNYFLSLYSICNDTIQLVQHYHMDVGLPLISISTFGASGVTSSQDGVLINFVCKHELGKMSLDYSTRTVTCKSFISEVPWVCSGIALSPSSGLCLSAHRVNHNYSNEGIKRKFMNRQMIALSMPYNVTAETVKVFLISKDPPMSPQSIMISLRLHIQQHVDTSDSLQDILHIYSELNQQDDIGSAQVARDMLLFLKHCCAGKREFQKELESIAPALENATEKLVIKHIQSCLNKATSEPTSMESAIIKAMLNWITSRGTTPSLASQSLDLASLDKIGQQSPDLHCAICCSQLNITGFLLAQCVKGHQMKLCALTLLPCQDLLSRTCEACGCPSVSLNTLYDVKMITSKLLCVLCGGHLRQSIF